MKPQQEEGRGCILKHLLYGADWLIPALARQAGKRVALLVRLLARRYMHILVMHALPTILDV